MSYEIAQQCIVDFAATKSWAMPPIRQKLAERCCDNCDDCCWKKTKTRFGVGQRKYVKAEGHHLWLCPDHLAEHKL
ncbi:MAG: hypothetical protein JST85_24450 [Acidobacteria bacterium]|nr:hypothetical protein [Acidobacteriota bacterium]